MIFFIFSGFVLSFWVNFSAMWICCPSPRCMGLCWPPTLHHPRAAARLMKYFSNLLRCICPKRRLAKSVRVYFSFSLHQGSTDFNTVNIHRTVGMYFLIFTGNRGGNESVHYREEGCIGKYTPQGPRDFPRAGILHPEAREIARVRSPSAISRAECDEY